MGARGLRLRGDRGSQLRRHLLLELHQDRAAAGGARRGRAAGADGRRPRVDRPRCPGGFLAGRHRLVRDRPRDQAPAARGPRRHRRDPPARRCDRALRGRARAPRPGHDRASAVTREWDAATYDRVSAPQVEWARAVLERLTLRGDETVLDAGCGSGRVTQLLLERLPRGHVIAVDSAPSMVEHARAALDPARSTVFACDLTELTLDAPVDAAFSNAVFHW